MWTKVITAAAALAAVAVAGGSVAALGADRGASADSSAPVTLAIASAPTFKSAGDSETWQISATNIGTNPARIHRIAVTAIGPSTTAAHATLPCRAGSFTADAPTTTSTEVPAGSVATLVGRVVVHFRPVAPASSSCLGDGAVQIALSSS
jgi:hypothetical protein